MEGKNSIFKKDHGKYFSKWIVITSLIGVLMLSTFLIIGLKSQYIMVDFCLGSVNCNQTPEQLTDEVNDIDIVDMVEPLEIISPASSPIKITVKPLGAAILAGASTSAALIGIILLSGLALPIELAIAIGAFVGTANYALLKLFY